MRAPFAWYGGKANMAKRIVALLPQHSRYIEPFAGAASVFFRKSPAREEILSDADVGLATFFTVVRDRPEEFIRLAALTAHSRELWLECKAGWRRETDSVRMAWRWWVVAVQSFSAEWGSNWASSVADRGQIPEACRKLEKAIAILPDVSMRLQGVTVECCDGVDVLRRYCCNRSLAYCDPPYMLSTRVGGRRYRKEMTAEQHERFVDALLELPGRFVVSGYANGIYKRLEDAGWARLDWPAVAQAVGRTRHTGVVGEGSGRVHRRVESLWLDPATARELALRSEPTLALSG